jgi:Abnormal spindle-like microcephaly-assoc'd, ASPM-SPD-2-Hydin
MLQLPLRAATNPLTCSPTSFRYGQVVVGRTETLLVAVTNSSQSSVTLSGVSSNSTEFKVQKLNLPRVVAARASLEVSVTFAPTSIGSVAAQVTFVSKGSSQTLDLSVRGTGVSSEPVTASPASVSFGNVDVGAKSTLPLVLTNHRSSELTLASLQTTGSAFSVTGAKFPLTLGGGQSVKLSATFTPQAVGLTGGSSYVTGPALNIPFTGTGIAATSKSQLTIIPDPLSFGTVADGTTETLTLGLSATGGSVTISSVSSSNSQFTVPGASLPVVIPAGHEVSLNVAFTPRNTEKTTATLSFASNAADSPTSEALAGTGSAAPYVSLSWNPSTSRVAGYNVYRSTSRTGSYTRINSSLDTNTSYTDTTVVAGTTYYYATTAVNSSGEQSGYSNEVEAVVP